MVNGNCAVVGCQNSRHRIRVWGKKNCDEHIGHTKKSCYCTPPCRLFKFPSLKPHSESKTEWIRLMKRTTIDNRKWSPGQSDMVCSEHFLDEITTAENPYPTLKLG